MARILTRALALSAPGVAAALWFASSCSPSTPVPVFGKHTSEDTPVVVTSMPEAVRVETLPPSPDKDAVWVDGSWTWAGRRWAWNEGSWQHPPEGAYYARPSFARLPVPVYDNDGGQTAIGYGMRLMFIPGHWHLPDGGTWQQDSGDAGVK